MKNRRNITGILLAIVSAVLFVSLICLCRKYQLQAKELQAELAYANAAKEEYTTELRNLQTQLAERRSLEENTTETGFVKKGGIYLIDTRSQLIALSQMIQEYHSLIPRTGSGRSVGVYVYTFLPYSV